MNAQEDNLELGNTPVTPAQIRAIMRLNDAQSTANAEAATPETPTPEASNLSDLANALNITVERADELLKQVEAIEQTPVTPAQIRAIIRLQDAQSTANPDAATLKDLAEALDIPVERAAELLAQVEASSAVLPPVPKKAKSDGNMAVWLNLAALVLSFIGIFVAGVLSLGHAFALSVPCGDNGGCDVIASNPASMIFGVPVAYLGLGGYLLLAAITATRAFKGLARTANLGMAALAFSGIGALFSFYLQYLSFTQIHAVCLWCLASAITMSVMFLVQAGLAQMDAPAAKEGSSETSVVFTVGLTLLAALGIGYESLHFLQTGKKLNLGTGIGMGNQTAILLLTPDSMTLGPDTAPIKIVEFSDLVCPSCRAIYPDVKNLVSQSNGKIQLFLRHRPLTHNPEHQMAIPAAFLAEYGRESGKGWAFVDEMYNHDNSELQTIDSIFNIAKKVGIDVNAAKARMKDTDPDWKRVLRDLDTAEKIDVTQTPTFVIFAPGAPPASALGHELFTTLQEPVYQAILKPNGK